MKKWFIILSMLCVTGFISTAVLAGRVYYEDLKVYEDYDKKELKTEALQNLYVDSVIPVEVHPTKGEPYVEFMQRYTDLVGFAPEYQLAIEERANTTYINLEQTKDIFLSLGVKENKAKLTLYLPEGDMKQLDIENQGYYSRTTQKQLIDLEGINVGQLRISSINADFNLKGSYDRVNIASYMNNSTLNMVSNSEVELHTSGSMRQNLEGKFKKVNIKDNDKDIDINSTTVSSIEIDNECGNIRLAGKFDKIKLSGYGNDIDLRSETECKLITEGHENTIRANGAFKVIHLEEQSGEAEIQTTTIPESIQMTKSANRETVSLTLPSNVPGFTLSYLSDSEDDRDECNSNYYCDSYNNEEDDNYSSELEQISKINHYIEQDFKKVQSEFNPIQKEEKDGIIVYKYGNGEIPITLNSGSSISLELFDGGYSSVVNKVN